MLVSEVAQRGTAALSVISSPGAKPISVWLPEAAEEPRFLLYSITKLFVACVALRLCEDGRLELDAGVANWFPRLPGANRMSVRELLNHTSGIPDYGPLSSYHESVHASPSQPWSFERFAAETIDQGLLFVPGEGWAYSNTGYMLLKRILEEIAETSLSELVMRTISRPLGLNDTAVAETSADLARLAPGVSSLLSSDGSPRDIREYHPGWVAHGVIVSTTSDTARFLDAIFEGRFLSARSLSELMTFVSLDNETDRDDQQSVGPLRPRKPVYGLGVMADPESDWGLTVGHSGGGPCYGAAAFHSFDLGGVSVCAAGAIEIGFSAEALVARVFDSFAA